VHKLRFAVIGIDHSHIYAQVDALVDAGAELVSFLAEDCALSRNFQTRYPYVRPAREIQTILEDPSIPLIVSATTNSTRATLGISVMRYAKDFMVSRAGFTLGTGGFLEIRKNRDLTGRPMRNHLSLVSQTGIYYFDCGGYPCPYAKQFIDDVLNRTDTAVRQQHCFLASRLALEAQDIASRTRRSTMQGDT